MQSNNLKGNIFSQFADIRQNIHADNLKAFYPVATASAITVLNSSQTDKKPAQYPTATAFSAVSNDVNLRSSAFIPSAPLEEIKPSAPHGNMPASIRDSDSVRSTPPAEIKSAENKIESYPVKYRLEHMRVFRDLFGALQKNDFQSAQTYINTLRNTQRLSDINSIVIFVAPPFSDWGVGSLPEYSFSLLHGLVSMSGGIKLLTENNDLCEAVNSQGLNFHGIPRINSFSLKTRMGSNALECLSSCDEGLELLASNPKLRDQITSAGLNTVINNDEYTLRRSPLYMLTKDKAGLKILENDATLRGKISKEGLNADVAIDHDKYQTAVAGESPLFNLALNGIGLKILAKDAVLRSKISVCGLNVIKCGGEFKNLSVLYLLSSDAVGQSLFLADNNLVEKITTESFNFVSTLHPLVGTSPLLMLSKSTNGKKVLIKTNLIYKADIAALNATKKLKPEEGSTALCYLAMGKQTRKVIVSKSFRHKITAHALNSVIKDGDHKGMSALFALSMFPAGRNMLFETLKTMIAGNALNSLVSNNKSFPHCAGWSAASVLVTSEYGNEMFIRKTPDLYALLTEKGFQSKTPSHLHIGEARPLILSEWLSLPMHVETHAELKAKYVISNLKVTLFRTQWNASGDRPEAVKDQIKEVQSAEKGEKSYDAALACVVSIGKKAAANMSLFAPEIVKTHVQKFVKTKNIYELR